MNAKPPMPRGPFVTLGVFVAVAAALVGGVLGYAAGGAYERSPLSDTYGLIGLLLGGIGGVLVAIAWVLVIWKLAQRYGCQGIVSAGTIMGTVAGIVDSTILHVGLGLASGRLPDMLTAWICGIGAGLIIGFFSGLGARVAAKWSLRHG